MECIWSKCTNTKRANGAVFTKCLKIQKIEKIHKKCLQKNNHHAIISLAVNATSFYIKNVEKTVKFEKPVDNSNCA